MPVGLGETVARVLFQVQAAGGDPVRQRLPQVGLRRRNQADAGAAPSAQLFAQPGDQSRAAGSATAASVDPSATGLLLREISLMRAPALPA
jgi:hypothetical protein